MELIVDSLLEPPVASSPVEIVERKGIGHPDTICDAIAEAVSVRLCRHYLERFGVILHHNVDKALLRGGTSAPAFGGGEVREPIEILLAGRVTEEHGGVRIPTGELATETCRSWLRANLVALDVDRDVKIRCLFRPGSPDLADLFQREASGRLANDSSCGAGFAPLSPLERSVLEVERALCDPAARIAHPEVGPDVKVLGVRLASRVTLTLAGAFVGRHVAGMDDYLEKKARLAERSAAAASRILGGPVDVQVNTADDPARGVVYLTVTGTSAEAGDDGQVGRGNRVNGLITPYRPMTLEGVAGKNPVTHVGKLFNVFASRVTADVVATVPGVAETYCRLAGVIGQPIAEPEVVHMSVRMQEGRMLAEAAPRIREIVRDHLAGLGTLWRAFLEGAVRVT